MLAEGWSGDEVAADGGARTGGAVAGNSPSARRQQGVSVEFVGVTKKYGALSAVEHLTLAVQPGEFLTLLGPSGSGKSTVLMLLAGLVAPSAGEIRVDGSNLSHVPANRRDQGVVFQNYALFPHMTVRENLAYPLAARGIAGQRCNALIARTVERLRVAELLDRYAHQLSGGQQQRVALARAVVFQPPLLLLDEALNALDRDLREEMQDQLRDLHRQLRTTIVFVTHDQREALTMSDRIAVLRAGRLAQLGPPREIYERPANSFVARFLGDTNFIEATAIGDAGGAVVIETAAGRRLLASAPNVPPAGRKLRAMVRPEALQLVPRDQSAAAFGANAIRGLSGRIDRAVFAGDFHRYWICSDDLVLSAKVASSGRNPAFEIGDRVDIVIHAKDLVVIED